MVKILALTVKPVQSPDTRYRILQYVEAFRDYGIEVDHQSLLSDHLYRIYLAEGRSILKFFYYVWAYTKRLCLLIASLRRYHAVWILRELGPIGPPFLEKLVFRLHRCVILDIDDAIFIPDEASQGFIHKRLRDFRKFEKTACGYRIVVCGNSYLADYFERLGARVMIVPTVVRAGLYLSVQSKPADRVRIGWLGTPTNHVHLEVIREAVKRLASRYDFELVVVGLNRPLNWDIDNIQYVSWELPRELDYLGMFDVGVMPLLDFEFVKGKCAFKVIQYMAAGLPVVTSPVGANLEVVEDGVNGFLAETDDEWVDRLERLITDGNLRRRMGARGRETVAARYSLESQWQRYADLLKKEARDAKHGC